MVSKKSTLAYLCDVITQTLEAYVEGKAAEKISVTHWRSQDFQLRGLKFNKSYPTAETDPENFGGGMQI